MKYAKENLDLDTNTVEIFGDREQVYWGYSLLRYINYEESLDDISGGENRLSYKYTMIMHKIDKVDYIIYFTKNYYYEECGQAFFTENSEVIYENESGGIIKYNITD